jgi:hypothetical protein
VLIGGIMEHIEAGRRPLGRLAPARCRPTAWRRRCRTRLRAQTARLAQRAEAWSA